jgi:hypothetical protein
MISRLYWAETVGAPPSATILLRRAQGRQWRLEIAIASLEARAVLAPLPQWMLAWLSVTVGPVEAWRCERSAVPLLPRMTVVVYHATDAASELDCARLLRHCAHGTRRALEAARELLCMMG